ncbi:MAG: FMN adenylyltransferase / Riboflavin kinase [uncultured Nocardioidaceae bacterium]|uniref:Riboflavin biosynthesis protein n=1 Tax=uncultured Nocardioidaceae bacterium TaxID=253824 RepID=A0A6J4ML48_9ACTN|nr:MAG: FMN adenylyltransferase / Riboflavin kinase [uncultured Nocardioidaceae bacterium]
MRVWRSLAEVPADLGRTVVTVGNFDGVHLGHQAVVRRAREEAVARGAEAVVAVTFDPHPVAVLRPELAPPVLTPLERRADLLAASGVDAMLVVPFDREVAGWSPERFVEDVLVTALHATAVVVGANFRFGARAAGDVALLDRVGRELAGTGRGFAAVGVPLDGGPATWSSTYVRRCLASGEVEQAAAALGRPVSVRGPVQRGDRRGRELGYPTANVAIGAEAAPADGVYAGWVTVLADGARHPAAISVGTNPTFAGERVRRVEAHVLDRDDLDLYDHEVEVVFTCRLRGMERFGSVEELLAAMARDVEDAREALSREPV